MIGFLIPNEKPLQTFVISVDSLESLTGLIFFTALPDLIESRLESCAELSGWVFLKIASPTIFYFHLIFS
jgi:endonuclease G